MNERPTQNTTTPSNKELVLKTYLTAGERNRIRRIYMQGAKIQITDGAPALDQINPDLLEEVEKNLIEITVISYDGSQESVYQRLLDSSPEEYDAVISECSKVQSGNLTGAK
jgi:hypothetical protein